MANALYFIGKGSVKTYRTSSEGKEFVTGIWKTGDFMGQLSLLGSGKKYLNSAVVLEDASVFEIPRADFERLICGNPVVAKKFIDIISHDLNEVRGQLSALAYGTVRQRVAMALLALHDKGIILDRPDEGIDIPREDFAGLVGTAKETAIRMLSDFKAEGLIAMGRARRIVLLKKEALRRIAAFG